MFIANNLKMLVVVPLSEQEKKSFKKLLASYGRKLKSVDELWKWYDFTEKTGIASF
jgi:hypothetical protein